MWVSVMMCQDHFLWDRGPLVSLRGTLCYVAWRACTIIQSTWHRPLLPSFTLSTPLGHTPGIWEWATQAHRIREDPKPMKCPTGKKYLREEQDFCYPCCPNSDKTSPPASALGLGWCRVERSWTFFSSLHSSNSSHFALWQWNYNCSSISCP